MTAAQVSEAVVATLSEMLRMPAARIAADCALARDLGVDSMTLTHLLVGVELRLGVRIPPGRESLLAGVDTVGDFASRFAGALEPS